jgi:hypothetical protein
MKSRILTLVVMLLALTVVLTSCGKKSDKAKLLSLYENYTKFIESDDHYNMLSDQKTYGEKMQAKVKEFFEKSGFKDEQEVTKVDEALKDDKDVVDARKKFEEASQKIYTRYIQEHPEMMQHQMQDSTQTAPEQTPVDTSKNK